MKKRMIALSGIAIATLLTFNACDSTSRYDDEAGSGIVNPDDGTTSGGTVTTNPEPFKPNLPENGGSIAQPVDNNNSDTNQTEDTYKTINGVYSITITPEYDSITSGQTQNVHYEVTNFFTKKPADDRAITYMNFEIDKRYAEFFDVAGNHGNVIEFGKGKASAKSTGDIALKSNSKSGQLLVNFNAVIDGTDVNLTKSFPIVVEKNKSSSMAIVPIGTTYKEGLFTQKFVIHVVDSYGNKAKDGTRVSTGVINNPKLYSRAYVGGTSEEAGVSVAVDSQTLPTNRYGDNAKVDYNPSYTTSVDVDDNNESVTVFSYTPNRTVSYRLKDDRGSLNKKSGTFSLPANSIDVNKDIISSLDTLIVLANKEQHKPYNLGGWDISSVNGGSDISLYDLDAGSDISNVSYVVGDEYRYDRCNETIMNAAASTFTSTEVKDGVAYAELRYVPAMVGKNVFIYANSKLDDKRIGISRKIILVGEGLEENTFSCKNEAKKGSGVLVNCTERFRMIQKSSGKIARDVYVSQPTTTGVSNYQKATISRTDCNGWATVSVYGVPPEKTATVSFGSFISDELIVEQK
jgi:hypothetical protein